MLGLSVHAQKDVTRFLGISVDGPKDEMIQKLKAKGFKANLSDSDALTGEFNGSDVNVFVVTNNNKVCRIVVSDANGVDETAIRIRFNTLCNQFEKNSKYLQLSDNQKIPDNERIYSGMSRGKRYEAIFYQNIEQIDTLAVRDAMLPKLLEKYTEEELENPTTEIANDILQMGIEVGTELIMKKSVWFMIAKEPYRVDSYQIYMYYDNEYNRANGEDL